MSENTSLSSQRSSSEDHAQVVGVRETAEFASGTSRRGKSRLVDVVGQSGGRSAAMTDVLTHHGFDATPSPAAPPPGPTAAARSTPAPRKENEPE